MTDALPPGLRLARTTPTLDEASVPQGLLHDHRIAADVWGRLIVSTGSLQLVFSGTDAEQTVDADHPGIIPPAQPHHVVIDGPVSFVVEFHRA